MILRDLNRVSMGLKRVDIWIALEQLIALESINSLNYVSKIQLLACVNRIAVPVSDRKKNVYMCVFKRE